MRERILRKNLQERYGHKLHIRPKSCRYFKVNSTLLDRFLDIFLLSFLYIVHTPHTIPKNALFTKQFLFFNKLILEFKISDFSTSRMLLLWRWQHRGICTIYVWYNFGTSYIIWWSTILFHVFHIIHVCVILYEWCHTTKLLKIPVKDYISIILLLRHTKILLYKINRVNYIVNLFQFVFQIYFLCY